MEKIRSVMHVRDLATMLMGMVEKYIGKEQEGKKV